MRHGSSDEVRRIAFEKYVAPALGAGRIQFSVAVKDVLQDLAATGFPPGNTPQVCTALRKEAFLRQHGIEIASIDGPPSKMSTTVVFHYRRVLPATTDTNGWPSDTKLQAGTVTEKPEARSMRLTEKLRGLLKDELTEYGGGEAFLKWVRAEESDKDAA